MSDTYTRVRDTTHFKTIPSDRIRLISQANMFVSVIVEAKSRGDESGIETFTLTEQEERTYNAALKYLEHSFDIGARDAETVVSSKDYEVER